jgi:hypothetical protein
LSTNWWVNQLTMADKTNHIMHISWDMDTKKSRNLRIFGRQNLPKRENIWLDNEIWWDMHQQEDICVQNWLDIYISIYIYIYIYMQICIINMSFNQEIMINDDILGHATISSVKFIWWFQLPKNTALMFIRLPGWISLGGRLSCQARMLSSACTVCNKWTTQSTQTFCGWDQKKQ